MLKQATHIYLYTLTDTVYLKRFGAGLRNVSIQNVLVFTYLFAFRFLIILRVKKCRNIFKHLNTCFWPERHWSGLGAIQPKCYSIKESLGLIATNIRHVTLWTAPHGCHHRWRTARGSFCGIHDSDCREVRPSWRDHNFFQELIEYQMTSPGSHVHVKDPINQDSIHQNPINQDTINQDPINQDPINQVPIR